MTTAEDKGIASRPQLKDFNTYLTCGICHGYLISAMSNSNCPHSFCRVCIWRHLESDKFCPVCRKSDNIDTLISDLRHDRLLQTVVYKVVPNLYRSEIERRTEFLKTLSESAELGCDSWRRKQVRLMRMPKNTYTGAERISLLLVRCESLPFEFIGAKDSNETEELEANISAAASGHWRYLLCPVELTIGLLKKYIRFKFDMGENFEIEIFYSDEALLDDYSLVDVVYIYCNEKVAQMTLYYVVFHNLRPETVDQVESECNNNSVPLSRNRKRKPEPQSENEAEAAAETGPSSKKLKSRDHSEDRSDVFDQKQRKNASLAKPDAVTSRENAASAFDRVRRHSQENLASEICIADRNSSSVTETSIVVTGNSNSIAFADRNSGLADVNATSFGDNSRLFIGFPNGERVIEKLSKSDLYNSDSRSHGTGNLMQFQLISNPLSSSLITNGIQFSEEDAQSANSSFGSGPGPVEICNYFQDRSSVEPANLAGRWLANDTAEMVQRDMAITGSGVDLCSLHSAEIADQLKDSETEIDTELRRIAANVAISNENSMTDYGLNEDSESALPSSSPESGDNGGGRERDAGSHSSIMDSIAMSQLFSPGGTASGGVGMPAGNLLVQNGMAFECLVPTDRLSDNATLNLDNLSLSGHEISGWTDYVDQMNQPHESTFKLVSTVGEPFPIPPSQHLPVCSSFYSFPQSLPETRMSNSDDINFFSANISRTNPCFSPIGNIRKTSTGIINPSAAEHSFTGLALSDHMGPVGSVALTGSALPEEGDKVNSAQEISSAHLKEYNSQEILHGLSHRSPFVDTANSCLSLSRADKRHQNDQVSSEFEPCSGVSSVFARTVDSQRLQEDENQESGVEIESENCHLKADRIVSVQSHPSPTRSTESSRQDYSTKQVTGSLIDIQQGTLSETSSKTSTGRCREEEPVPGGATEGHSTNDILMFSTGPSSGSVPIAGGEFNRDPSTSGPIDSVRSESIVACCGNCDSMSVGANSVLSNCANDPGSAVKRAHSELSGSERLSRSLPAAVQGSTGPDEEGKTANSSDLTKSRITTATNAASAKGNPESQSVKDSACAPKKKEGERQSAQKGSSTRAAAPAATAPSGLCQVGSKISVGTQTNMDLLGRYFHKRGVHSVNSFRCGKGGPRGATVASRDRSVKATKPSLSVVNSKTSDPSCASSSASLSPGTAATSQAAILFSGQGAPILFPTMSPVTINGKSTLLIAVPGSFSFPRQNGLRANMTLIQTRLNYAGNARSPAPGLSGAPVLLQQRSPTSQAMVIGRAVGAPLQLIVPSAISNSALPPDGARDHQCATPATTITTSNNNLSAGFACKFRLSSSQPITVAPTSLMTCVASQTSPLSATAVRTTTDMSFAGNTQIRHPVLLQDGPSAACAGASAGAACASVSAVPHQTVSAVTLPTFVLTSDPGLPPQSQYSFTSSFFPSSNSETDVVQSDCSSSTNLKRPDKTPVCLSVASSLIRSCPDTSSTPAATTSGTPKLSWARHISISNIPHVGNKFSVARKGTEQRSSVSGIMSANKSTPASSSISLSNDSLPTLQLSVSPSCVLTSSSSLSSSLSSSSYSSLSSSSSSCVVSS